MSSFGSITYDNFSNELNLNSKPLVPVGVMLPYAGAIAPSGWLLCEGQELSRTEYSDLFNIIGITYGSSNALVFNLPDFRSRMAVGKDVSKPLGTYSGSDEVTIDANNLPVHSHTGTTATDGSHTHTATDSGHTHSYDDAYFAENTGGQNVYGTSAGTDGDNDYQYRTPTPSTYTGYANISVSTNGSHTHTFTTSSFGSATPTPVSIQNPFLAINYIIRY